MAVIEEDSVGCGVIADDNVDVAVTVEVRKLGGVGGGKVSAQWASDIESRAALVEEDEVLLGPMPPVGNDDVEILVAIDVADTHASGTECLCAEVETAASEERSLLIRRRDQ